VRSLRTLGFVAVLGVALLIHPHVALALNCSDFPSQAAAQAHLRQDPTDPDRIDADGDGLACENTQGPYDLDPVLNPLRGTRTPIPEPTASPGNEPSGDLGRPETPDEGDDEDSGPSADEPIPTPTRAANRSPLLGPPPPPLWALQPGAPPQFAKPPSTTAEPGSSATPASGGLGYVQGSDTSIGPVVMQRAPGVIQPPNTGDGGLLR
jgi:hypothetical protein